MEVVDQYHKITPQIVKTIADLDNFKMYSQAMQNNYQIVHLNHFIDCDDITNPSQRDYVFVLMRGAVAIIADEKSR